MGSPAYEAKMTAGLHKAFEATFLVVMACMCIVGGFWLTIDAFVQRNWWELLSFPAGILGAFGCIWLASWCDRRGVRYIDEATAIRNLEYQQEREQRG